MSKRDMMNKNASTDAFTLPHDHGQEGGEARVRVQLARIGDFETIAALFRLLDDPSRVRIFWLLCHCEECVVNLSALLEMTSPAVSHHLRQLKESGLVVSRREGREVHYRAADTDAARLLHRAIERLMDIACPRSGEGAHDDGPCPAEPAHCAEAGAGRCPAAQAEIVRRVHDEIVAHPERRVTIEALARQYLVNPTTLKASFKSVYGASLASHMNTHRMEHAAMLLTTTQESVAQIAAAVGYGSQSKFADAFRRMYGLLPAAYRKEHRPGASEETPER